MNFRATQQDEEEAPFFTYDIKTALINGAVV